MMNRRHLLVSGVAAALPRAALAAPPAAALAKSPGLAGVGADDIAFMAKLYDAALSSRRTVVNFYSANAPVDPNMNLGVVFRAFERTFPGIHIQGTRISGAELAARLDGEWASGRRQGDIVSGAELLVSKGRILAFDPPLSRNVNPAFRDPNNYFVATAIKQFGLTYNTDQVRPEEVPQSLDQLLNDKWRGRVTLAQPTGVELVDDFLYALIQQHGIDIPTIRRLAAFVPRRDRSAMASMASNVVSQGRYSFGLWSTSSVARQLASRGAPIAVAPFRETIVTPTSHGILKDGPSPDASKLLINWMFSPLAQKLYASAVFEQGTVPGSPAPAGIPKPAAKPFLDIPSAERPALVRKFHDTVVSPIFGPAT